MNTFLNIVSVLFFGMGVLAVVASKSDIQIILAVLCFGFGFMILALSAILSAVRNQVKVS